MAAPAPAGSVEPAAAQGRRGGVVGRARLLAGGLGFTAGEPREDHDRDRRGGRGEQAERLTAAADRPPASVTTGVQSLDVHLA